MQFKTFQYHTTIQETYLDVFGHVNNAVYLQLFEEARWDAITAQGYGLDKILATNVGPIILEIHIKYLRELKARQLICIETQVLSYIDKIGTMEQIIKNNQDKVCCSLELKFGLFDMLARKLILPTPEWMKAVTGG